MDPKTFLIWSCAVIFSATGLITLLGLIQAIKIEKGFMNKLFISLILEIVAIGVGVFSDFFSTPEKQTSNFEMPTKKVWMVTSKIQYLDLDGNPLPVCDYINEIDIKQSSPSVIVEKNDRRVRFYAFGTEINDRDINVTFFDKLNRFNTYPFNLKLDSVVSINEETGEIDVGTIFLSEPTNFEYNSTNTLNSTTNGPPIN